MDRFERIARVVAVAVGGLMLAFSSTTRWWLLFGLAPLAMGLFGWGVITKALRTATHMRHRQDSPRS